MVGRLFLMGSPWDGAPKAIKVMLEGLDIVGRRLLNRFGLGERMRQLILSFPSYYQLIPHTNRFLRDQNNQEIDPYADDRWLEGERQREYLKDALAFNRELGNSLSVDTVCFFGRFKPTTTAGWSTLGRAGAGACRLDRDHRRRRHRPGAQRGVTRRPPATPSPGSRQHLHRPADAVPLERELNGKY
jgi:hypothetical protein